MTADSQDTASAAVAISNRRGLHARAAAKFVKLAETFDARVKVQKGDLAVDGASIMGLMMLAAAAGDEILLTATGKQAQDVVAALVALVGAKFDED